MDKAIIVYHTFSGNTEEVAEIIEETLKESKYEVDLYRVGSGFIPELVSYNLCLLGTYTWDEGTLPEEMEEFIEFNNVPENTAVFGTGDTQFGGDALFCKAVDILAIKCKAKYIPLKIEQSPRGVQENKVRKWSRQIIARNERKM